ncbi:MAG: putative damage-inducible protein DinB [Cyclobacteriaceae bacterium]|jgi:uncharacterized damage-inducible protein DinB
MPKEDLEFLRYPIGRFLKPDIIDENLLSSFMQAIAELPGKLTNVTEGLTDEQLDAPYRPDGWTVRQLVHHIADSHMNSCIRFKWTLTEENPTIKSYDEKLWAEMPEARTAPIDLSLNILTALHARWVLMLKNLTEEDLNKAFVHPESGRQVQLDLNIALYAWHSEHHLAHIVNLIKIEGWDS